MQAFSDIVKVVKQNNHDIPNLIQNINNISLQIGEYKLSAQSTDINGWLICDGRSLSRNQYSLLYKVIGKAFGNVDNNSFSLPDFRGRTIGCVGKGVGLTDRLLGSVVSTENQTLPVNDIPPILFGGNMMIFSGIVVPA